MKKKEKHLDCSIKRGEEMRVKKMEKGGKREEDEMEMKRGV